MENLLLNPNVTGSDEPLRPVVRAWLRKIDDAMRHREETWEKHAREVEKYFDEEENFMWEHDYADGPSGYLDKSAGRVLPYFRMQLNRVFEGISLFGPFLYHQNPKVLCTPRQRADVSLPLLVGDLNTPEGAQMAQQLATGGQRVDAMRQSQASLCQTILNWLQDVTDKKTEMRWMIQDALLTGMGVAYHDVYRPPDSEMRYPRSIHMSPYDVLFDPDAEYARDIEWMAIRWCQPVFRVEEKFLLEEGSIHGNRQSRGGRIDAQLESITERGARALSDKKSFDTMEYWEVFSKCGFGDRLKDNPGIIKRGEKGALDLSGLGDFCYLAVTPEVPWPLNLPDAALSEGPESVLMRTRWPIPYHMDEQGWPITWLQFHAKQGQLYGISHFKPIIGPLRFVNWCMSFLADKVAAGGKTYVGIAKQAAEEIRDQIRNGVGPFQPIEISTMTGRSLQEVISFLNAPTFDYMNMWQMVAAVIDQIDKTLGLTELMYGTSRNQIRSAREAEVKAGNAQIRPDDMANVMESALSKMAVREMQAARMVMEGRDVEPVVGPDAAQFWDYYILQQDADQITRDFDYRIEAGSARKPNFEGLKTALNEIAQPVMGMAQAQAEAGNVAPWNGFWTLWGQANNMDVKFMMLEPPPPPDPNQPTPEMMEAQAKQQEVMAKQQESQQQLAIKQQEAMLKLQELMQKMQLDQAEHRQEMRQDRERHKLEMQQTQEKNRIELTQARAKASAQARRPSNGK